jgi:hypothetical protein
MPKFPFRKAEVGNPEVNGVKNQDLGSGKPLPRHIPYNERFPVQAQWAHGQYPKGMDRTPAVDMTDRSRASIFEQNQQASDNNRERGGKDALLENHRKSREL